MRCSRCGNENLEGNRFCGMCGATLLTVAPASAPSQATAPSPPATPSATGALPSRSQAPAAASTSAPVSDYSPGISGPSFLGLNDPGPRKRASLNADPHGSSSSRNLDYLLEDDEPRHGGAGKFVLILLALALAGGFGYLRWKNQKFGWLGAGANKPSAAAQNADTTDPNSSTPPASTAPSTPAATPSIQLAPESSAAAPASTNTGSPSTASPAAGATTTTPTTSSTPASGAPANPDNGAPSNTAPAAAAPAATDPAASAPETPAESSPKPAKPADTPPPKPAAAAKPTAAAKPAKPYDPVSEAQKYLYGKGVTQDCDRGMRLLKPAVNQSNPKAMVEMGALYSAGLCTPHDLPTAYLWFSRALRKEPDNQAVANDLQKLWGEMTQPERQLAIKLTQ